MNEYASRINRVIDYINENVDKELTLDELSAVANFSKFHFHRIFAGFTGETLFSYIQRIRLERAANFLLANVNKSVTDIAFDCGFTNPASFTRSFNNKFGMSPSKWRETKINSANSNISKVKSNTGKPHSSMSKAALSPNDYTIEYKNNEQIWRIKMTNIETNVIVKELPETTVAYVRHVGPYKGDADLFERLYNKLFAWAGPRNLIKFPETQSIIIYHDPPDITEQAKLRTSVCITVPQDTEVEGEVGKLTIESGKYAFARFEIDKDGFEQAWKFVYGTWLPDSGFQPDDRPCFELYPSDKNKPGSDKFVVDICVPVKPL